MSPNGFVENHASKMVLVNYDPPPKTNLSPSPAVNFVQFIIAKTTILDKEET